MATTVDDLIYLKDDAVAACAEVLAAWETGDFAGVFDPNMVRTIVERAELYDAADEDDQAVSIEDHERLEAVCELEDCPMRDPHNPAGHQIREHNEEQR
jgi:hypothetical protein